MNQQILGYEIIYPLSLTPSLRFSPISSILLRPDPVRNEPPVPPCIKPFDPCKSGKLIAELQREPVLTHVITLAFKQSPRGLTCLPGTGS